MLSCCIASEVALEGVVMYGLMLFLLLLYAHEIDSGCVCSKTRVRTVHIPVPANRSLSRRQRLREAKRDKIARGVSTIPLIHIAMLHRRAQTTDYAQYDNLSPEDQKLFRACVATRYQSHAKIIEELIKNVDNARLNLQETEPGLPLDPILETSVAMEFEPRQ